MGGIRPHAPATDARVTVGEPWILFFANVLISPLVSKALGEEPWTECPALGALVLPMQFVEALHSLAIASSASSSTAHFSPITTAQVASRVVAAVPPLGRRQK